MTKKKLLRTKIKFLTNEKQKLLTHVDCQTKTLIENNIGIH